MESCALSNRDFSESKFQQDIGCYRVFMATDLQGGCQNAQSYATGYSALTIDGVFIKLR